MSSENREQLLQKGFCVLSGVLNESHREHWLKRLHESLDGNDPATLVSGESIYGARDLLRQCPDVLQLIQPVSSVANEILGETCGVVRGLYFDKPPACSWNLPWHRDRTIAVKDHVAITTAFRNPTIKAGVPHYVAPHALLRQMLTFRFHLDAMTSENGPLIVIPSSHETQDEVDQPLNEDAEEIHLAAGDVFVMRPLLMHRSIVSKEGTTLHRRVIHLETAAIPQLPDDVQWHTWKSFPRRH